MILAFEVSVAGVGGIQNDSLDGKQKGDQPPASSLPCAVDYSNDLMMWLVCMQQRTKAEGSISKQLSQTGSNLECSFFNIIVKRVLDPIVFHI